MTNTEGIEVRLFDKSRIILGEELGSGSFGKVCKATVSGSKLSTVAVKVFHSDIRREKISQKERETAYEELLKLAVINHENIVKLHGMVENELPWLIFEYMKDGNLLEYVRKTDNIKDKTLVRFCGDICNGMTFLHGNNVLHKDLAARNILLSDKTAKIADLGLASFLRDDQDGTYALNGKLFPFRHAAKECIIEQIYTFESDVWSFGILMYEIFTKGSVPYGRDMTQPEVRKLIASDITPLSILEPQCSSRVHKIMTSILKPQRSDRPSFKELVTKFKKLLVGKFSSEQSSEDPSSKDVSGFETFHRIIAGGLSSSISSSSLQQSSPPTKARNSNESDHFLQVTQSSRSTSTPNLLNLNLGNVPHASVRVRARKRSSAQFTAFSVAVPSEPQLKSTSSSMEEPGIGSTDQRQRANSTNARNPPLVDDFGMVVNRFGRRP